MQLRRGFGFFKEDFNFNVVGMALEFKKIFAKPLVATEDMTAEMANETVEIITAAVDKFLSTENYEKAAQAVKDGMDKKFGPTWHCCIGEGFGYDVTYNTRNMLMLYYGEKLGILVFKF